MTSRQSQKAGNDSQQLQIGAVNVFGIDEKRVREIFDEKYSIARNNFTIEAIEIADGRIAEFENRLISKMITLDGALEAFADPGFQMLLVKAQKTAAVTERQADYDLLSELMIHRFKKGQNRSVRTGIDRAVEIVDHISDEALLGLTVIHAVTCFTPKTGCIHKGLDVLDDLFGKFLYGSLPNGNDWLDHLDVLNAVRLSSLGGLIKIQEYYPKRLEGYVDVGIEKASENYSKAIELLTNVSFSSHSLIEHELNPNFVRLEVCEKKHIDTLIVETNINGSLVITPLSGIQKTVLHSIYELYKKDEVIKKMNTSRFMDEWDKRQNLKKVRAWWDNIEVAVQITSVGKVLAHANAQRCDKTIPSLD